MPGWAFIPIILVALLACPISMWVMSKVMRRKMTCAMCESGTHGQHNHNLKDLEARKAAIEREIAQAKAEVEQNGNVPQAAEAKEGRS